MSALNKIMHGNWMMESSGYGFDELGYIGEGGENMSIVERARAELAALEAVAEAAQMSAFDMEKIHSYYSKYAPCTGSACGFLKHQKELTEALAALRKAQE